MGKKPLLGLCGAFWLGAALVGCDSCGCKKDTYDAKPTYPLKSASNDPKPDNSWSSQPKAMAGAGAMQTRDDMRAPAGGGSMMNTTSAQRPLSMNAATPTDPVKDATAGGMMTDSMVAPRTAPTSVTPPPDPLPMSRPVTNVSSRPMTDAAPVREVPAPAIRMDDTSNHTVPTGMATAVPDATPSLPKGGAMLPLVNKPETMTAPTLPSTPPVPASPPLPSSAGTGTLPSMPVRVDPPPPLPPGGNN